MVPTQFIAALVLLSSGAFASTAPRQLSYTKIAGYEPGSDVTEHNRVDLDQKEMETYLSEKPPNFIKAKAIYENGAHSGAHARVTVNALTGAVAKASSAVQAGNPAAKGYVKKGKGVDATSVDLTYTSTCVDNLHSKDYSVAGCYSKSGAITVNGTVNIGVPSAVANRYRNLAGFSMDAGKKMAGQAAFEKFKAYYGKADYGHHYVTAALDGSGSFAGKDDVSRVEGAKKGSAYMNVWMYVIREMEDAIDDCNASCVACNDDPVHAWDEAVAFYTGSLEGADGAGSGKMLYALADKRCANYMTCEGGTTSGVSQVNKQILPLFKQGQAKLLQSKCSDVPAIRDSIIKLMSVPLIQGALRYAFKVANLQGGSKEKAEGAVFAASILPLVSSCSQTSAATIAKNMKIDSTSAMGDGFAAVKKAFESTYSCLGVTCAQVGGLILSGSDYSDGFGPCSDAALTSTASATSASSTTGSTASGVVGAKGMDMIVILVAMSIMALATQ